MAIDPSKFFPINVIDTCSIWNILSSKLFYYAILRTNCSFACTHFVYYECLHRRRQENSMCDLELQKRFQKEIKNKKFKICDITIEDLQDLEILEKRKKVSKGELSSIVFAKKTEQAFMTDDQGARKLAQSVIDKKKVQTTPHLFGWLIYSDILSDADKGKVIEEHKENGRPLEQYFEEIYTRALELKLAFKKY